MCRWFHFRIYSIRFLVLAHGVALKVEMYSHFPLIIWFCFSSVRTDNI